MRVELTTVAMITGERREVGEVHDLDRRMAFDLVQEGRAKFDEPVPITARAAAAIRGKKVDTLEETVSNLTLEVTSLRDELEKTKAAEVTDTEPDEE